MAKIPLPGLVRNSRFPLKACRTLQQNIKQNLKFVSDYHQNMAQKVFQKNPTTKQSLKFVLAEMI